MNLLLFQEILQPSAALDAQISMKLPKLQNSMIKIGASNILNKYYMDAIGNSQIGGLYYMSFGYNVF